MIDIEHAIPNRWDKICGNKTLVEYLKDLVWGVRKEGRCSGYNALIYGPSRTGKSSAIKFGIQCLGCLNLDLDTLNPCGTCFNCSYAHHVCGNRDWEQVSRFLDGTEASTPVELFVASIDCPRATESELDDLLLRVRRSDEQLRIVHLEEVHRLARRFMDEKLLKSMDDFPAIWIASSANVKSGGETEPLDKMFQNRFTYQIATEVPTKSELVEWLTDRCLEWGIGMDAPEKTLSRLAERSNHIVGLALKVLNKAHNRRSKELTYAMVEEHPFGLEA